MTLLDGELYDFTKLETYLPSANKKDKERMEEKDFPTNYYLAPGYDSMQLIQEVEDLVNAPTGSIEQMYLYLTDKGARAFSKLSGQEDYVAVHNALPMEAVVDALMYRLEKTQLDPQSLDILCLGSGEARTERRLVQVLRRRTNVKTIRLFLLDVSPLFSDTGYQKSKEAFASDPDIQVIGMRGNFFHLQRYHSLLDSISVPGRMLLVTMLGYTFSNLTNEVDFLRYNLGVFKPSTCFLADLVLPYAPHDQPDAIAKADPLLAEVSKWWTPGKPGEEFVAVPILSYRKGMTQDQLRTTLVLDNRTAYVPKSYVVEMRAVLGDNVQLTMQRFKRHDPEGIQEVFQREKWSLIRSFPYWENRYLACLFQKK